MCAVSLVRGGEAWVHRRGEEGLGGKLVTSLGFGSCLLCSHQQPVAFWDQFGLKLCSPSVIILALVKNLSFCYFFMPFLLSKVDSGVRHQLYRPLRWEGEWKIGCFQDF